MDSELDKLAKGILKKYPVSKRSASMPLLHLVQSKRGYIDMESMRWIAELVGEKPVSILELVTFYPGYKQSPSGKHHFRICRTLSCAMRDSEGLMSKFCKVTGIDESKITHDEPVGVSEDGKYSIEYVECLASCGTAPVCLYGEELLEDLNEEKMLDFMKKLESK